MKENTIDDSAKLYTQHGRKKSQGKLSVINGQNALAYYDGDEIIGYTTQEEMNKAFYTRTDLPQYNLDF